MEKTKPAGASFFGGSFCLSGFISTRYLARWLHILVALINTAYIYTPLHSWPASLTLLKWVNFPVLILTGAWLMLGNKIWFGIRKRLIRAQNEKA